MKKKQLEIRLQQIPAPDVPKPELEQYTTPATIVADILYTAYQFGDITNKSVVDLGCGTGIFAIGAALMGAQTVTGIDIDPELIRKAKHSAQEQKVQISFLTQNITDVKLQCDTVLMNPPFGAQKSNLHADRRFIEKACRISTIIYSLHLNTTIPFIQQLLKALHAEITWMNSYSFPIKWSFAFHTKERKTYPVTAIRIETKKL